MVIVIAMSHLSLKSSKWVVVELLLLLSICNAKVRVLGRDSITVHIVTSVKGMIINLVYNVFPYSILYTVLSLEFKNQATELTDEEKEYKKVLQDQSVQTELADIINTYILNNPKFLQTTNPRKIKSLQILEKIVLLLGKLTFTPFYSYRS